MNIDFNNSIFVVGLTEKGMEVMRQYCAKVSHHTHCDFNEELASRSREDGLYSFTFKDFMAIFGGEYNSFFLNNYFTESYVEGKSKGQRR